MPKTLKKILAGAAVFAAVAAVGAAAVVIQSHSVCAVSDSSVLKIRSIDVMKYTKDTMTNQTSDAEIENLVSTLAQANINYIAISMPMDPSSDYPVNAKPAPRDAYAFTQKWADAIHSHGLGIIWRGTWSGIEGIYGFQKRVGPNRFPAGTLASAQADAGSSWLGKTYQYIIANPNFFQDGDIWAPLPERTEGIFSDDSSFLSYDGAGIQQNFANFSVDLKKTSDLAFAQIGKKVSTGMTANNYTEVSSTWLPQELFDTTNIISIDYYGNTHTPQEMDADLRAMYALRHKQIFLQEWADYWNSAEPQAERTEYLQSIYAVLQKLQSDGILAGVNYWGGWENNAEGLLVQDSAGFHFNYRADLLAEYFGAAGSSSTAANAATANSTADATSSTVRSASNTATAPAAAQSQSAPVQLVQAPPEQTSQQPVQLSEQSAQQQPAQSSAPLAAPPFLQISQKNIDSPQKSADNQEVLASTTKIQNGCVLANLKHFELP